MKITKNLKYATFEYDEEKKSFTISNGDGLYTTVELNKVYAFAFMRFVVRMAQRNWYRKVKDKSLNKQKPIELAEHPFEDELNLWSEEESPPELSEEKMDQLLDEVKKTPWNKTPF